MIEEDPVIKEGDCVVVSRTFDVGNNKIIPVQKSILTHFGKLNFFTDALIGSRYGDIFKIVDKSLVKIEDFESFDSQLSTEMVTKLITFDQKSQFSQEKIIKKKKKQNHANILTVIKPRLELLHEVFYARGKIGGLRIDLLSQILSFANIQNNTRCLLFDHNLGILTAAILSRSLPDGQCVQVMTSIELVHNTRNSLELLNINESTYKGHLFAISIADAYQIYKGTDNFDEEERLLFERNQKKKCSESKIDSSNNSNLDSTDPVAIKKAQAKLVELTRRDQRRQNKYYERSQATILLKSKSFDSLIMYVQNDNPLPILKIFYEFLNSSKQFVIYSDTIEQLVECYQYLKDNRLAIALHISESWLRSYQVLPDRTRPEMNTIGYGGYILSGIKVLMSTS